MSEPSFNFIAEMVHKILAYLDPPNKLLQSEDMDLLTGDFFNVDGEKSIYLLLSKIVILIPLIQLLIINHLLILTSNAS